jgi:hypothetical protein
MAHDWQGKWIWPTDSREINTHVLVRKDFDLAEAPGVAKLLIAAESFAVVYLNGVKVHFTTSLSYPGQHYYEEADVAGALKPGRNQIGLLVRYLGISSGASCPKDPGVACELHVERPGGESVVIASDESWKVMRLDAWLGRQRRSHWHNLDLIEVMDYGRLPKDWPMVADLSAFETPHAERVPGVRLGKVEPRPFPKAVLKDYDGLHVLKAGLVADRSAEFDIPALAVSEEEIVPADLGVANLKDFVIQPPGEGKAAALLLGLGKYMAGYPTLVAEGGRGVVIDIAYHESLKDGRFDIRDTRAYTADRYILGDGPAEIVTDEWKGLRYLQLTFRDVRSPLRVRDLRLVESTYPVEQKAFFRSSSAKLDRIFEICLNAARLCMQDNIMDCPWREKRQWIADAQRIALLNHYALSDRKLVRGVLRQHVHIQDTSGRMWVCQPLLEEYPCQTMEWLRAIVEYDQYVGDETLIAEIADNIELLHRWFLRCRDAKGLFFDAQKPIINWMDHPYSRVWAYQFQTPYLMMNLRYLLFLEDVATVLRRVGRAGEARKALAERKRLAAIIPECFLDEQTGLLRDCADASVPVTFSEMAHALAVLTKVTPGQEAQLWDRYAAYSAEHPENTLAPSPYGKYLTFEALGRLGRRDEIVTQILEFWGPMVDAGSDTAWESFHGRDSQCHGWSGAPVIALMRHVLKMDPRKAGRRKVKNVGGLAWVACEIRG